MRTALSTLLLMTMCLAPATAPAIAPPVVSLFRAGEKKLSSTTQAALADWAVELLKTASFNTDFSPKVTKESVADVQHRYRQTVRGDCLVVTFDSPRQIKTACGEVTALEIVAGLNRRDEVVSELFTIDPTGRVIAHAMYRLDMPDDIQPKAAMTETYITETSLRIGMYIEQNRNLPADLAALPVREGYRNAITDAWGKPLKYVADGDDRFTVSSTGEENTAGITKHFQIRDGRVQAVP